MPYLAREAVAASEFEQLKAAALERALAIVARARHQRAYKDLSLREKVAVKAAAEAAVAEEARLLALTVDEVLAQDVRPFECAVNELVIAVVLLQDEFDALVSFVFNVGISAFKRSHLLKLINENRYRAGTAAERNQAIEDIANAFAAWNTAAGKVLDGLTRRRRAEADLFLKPAREALAALRRTPSTATVVPIAPNPARRAR
jgi:GH24 family phage-related lysozyme (muramidase)